MAKPFSTSNPETITARPTGRTPMSEWDAAAIKGWGITIRGVFPRSPFHHLIPRELLKFQDIREILVREKINIDDYAVQISDGEHSAIHTMGYNDKWLIFFHETHINPSRAMILAQMEKMKRDYLITEHTQPYVKTY